MYELHPQVSCLTNTDETDIEEVKRWSDFVAAEVG